MLPNWEGGHWEELSHLFAESAHNVMHLELPDLASPGSQVNEAFQHPNRSTIEKCCHGPRRCLAAGRGLP
jgi:hypothetical protein